MLKFCTSKLKKKIDVVEIPSRRFKRVKRVPCVLGLLLSSLSARSRVSLLDQILWFTSTSYSWQEATRTCRKQIKTWQGNKDDQEDTRGKNTQEYQSTWCLNSLMIHLNGLIPVLTLRRIQSPECNGRTTGKYEGPESKQKTIVQPSARNKEAPFKSYSRNRPLNRKESELSSSHPLISRSFCISSIGEYHMALKTCTDETDNERFEPKLLGPLNVNSTAK